MLFQSYGFIDESESDSLSADRSNVTLLLIGRESGLLPLSRIAKDVSGFKGVVSSPTETTELLLDLPVNLNSHQLCNCVTSLDNCYCLTVVIY